MRYLSVCSGIEAATVAWHHMGWSPAGFAEIEKFPAQVLAHHYPNTTNFGDLTKHEGWNIAPGTVDLLVGGTPCQAFSIAGLRRGMDDERGQLTLEFVRLAARLRPRWIVWENVPGVLSSGGGRDFGSFLGALAQLGYGFSYRVLDAQYFGVMQRRRRCFVVAYLGDWRCAAAVLFEPESLRGDSASGNQTKETIASGSRSGIESDGRSHNGTQELKSLARMVAFGEYSMDGTASTIKRRDYKDATDLVIVQNGTRVRRLTPIECERLQGFPDGYTNIKNNGKDTADSLRYQALGNSMAVPVMRWIGQRIETINRLASQSS